MLSLRQRYGTRDRSVRTTQGGGSEVIVSVQTDSTD